MTDKEQIIIDGVDIVECDFFSMGFPFFKDPCTLYPHGTRCSENKNCYYKQLVRKTQECEELKKQLMQKDEINTFFNTQIEGWSSDPCGVCEYKGEYTRYRKALEEIKEIAVSTLGHSDWAGQRNREEI